ncbi:hypothetical protein HFP89_15570 [Wenzhouxiangella sp. XN79A]|uniref:M36 family metallopeptidase n=1 Tax=Wenzhouxiangella sp. XN79A TaxID=2724193 RepID=UPI00144AD2AC|nr:M36 family metallopeptidase [Wenzhouxiangella sp. XN79A]NKI36590.1 hypothetical protein [Wenzhouxiangella sp. XN79A]
MRSMLRGLALAALVLCVNATAGTPQDLALQALEQRAASLGLRATDLADVRIRDAFTSRHNGVTHVWMQQYVDDLPVALGVANANVLADGRISSLHSRMSAEARARAANRTPTLDAIDAVMRYASVRDLDTRVLPRITERTSDEDLTLSGGSLADGPIPARLSWYEHKNQLRLVWDIAVDEAGRPDWYNAFIDAHSGEILFTVNWTQEVTYRVFPEPLEHPGEGPDQRVVDPHDPTASPLGWHDDGNQAYTDTRGNNVRAQDDLDANNTGGSRPDGGAALVFDFPIDLATQQPIDYLDFAITNLFYWNNRLHDVLWHFGFDEPAGNFQVDNFGNGGVGGDLVIADAQDGSGTNNANFSTPPDGSPGRMQMFRFTGSAPPVVRIDAPAPSAGDYPVAVAGFGGAVDGTGAVGTLQLVDDGSASPEQGCGALQGFTAGRIAVIRRGGCEFGLKALNAEQAGAIAAIIVNNDGGNGTITMAPGAVGDQVTVPTVMVGNADGDTFIADLGGSVSGRVFSPGSTNLDRDSDLDAGVIAHEYGHGLSIRLTGGPSNSSCLFGSQQAGEGWSDFLALWFTAKPGDQASDLRGVGGYVTFRENIPGAGIRPFPYTRDMTANPATYETVGSVSVPHGVGTVFNSALWDMYWNLVDKHGFDPDFIGGNGGNHIAMQLVIDGLKLQGCGPTFLDTRDAMLEADRINNGGANQCEIWNAFARRGMGADASDGGGPTTLAVSNGFALPQSCGENFFRDGFETLP